jgi:hypothetical protein
MLNAEFHQKSKIQHPKSNIVFNPSFNIQNPKLKHPMITWKRTLRMGCEILNEQF